MFFFPVCFVNLNTTPHTNIGPNFYLKVILGNLI